MILETLVNLSRGNLSESLRNEIRTSGGFDVAIDAGRSFSSISHCLFRR